MKLENYPTLLDKYAINTPLRKAHLMAQIMAESGGVSKRESLYFKSISSLINTFKTPFKDKTDSFVAKYMCDTKKCANYVYANRMGNGDESSGDGYKYRAGGLLQNTGKSQFQWLTKQTRLDFVNNPDLILIEANALICALEYWKENDLNKYADLDNLDAISDIVNIGHRTLKVGDSNGYLHRKKYLEQYKKIYVI